MKKEGQTTAMPFTSSLAANFDRLGSMDRGQRKARRGEAGGTTWERARRETFPPIVQMLLSYNLQAGQPWRGARKNGSLKSARKVA
eukprot:scaffold10310_cov171-Amphora_coffeaeformis.AAC.7